MLGSEERRIVCGISRLTIISAFARAYKIHMHWHKMRGCFCHISAAAFLASAVGHADEEQLNNRKLHTWFENKITVYNSQ